VQPRAELLRQQARLQQPTLLLLPLLLLGSSAKPRALRARPRRMPLAPRLRSMSELPPQQQELQPPPAVSPAQQPTRGATLLPPPEMAL
jgi:hypothetical protein